MNRVLRRSLSIILSLTMVSSMTAIAVTSASASTVPEDANVGEQNSSDSKGKSYSLDEIYTDYLFSHTDKSSEVEYEGEIKNEVANANSDQVYADFHFSNVPNNDGTSSGSSDSMSTRAEKDLNDENSSNPLAGYSVINPDEFLFGQINRNEQHKGSIYTFNDNDMEIDKYPDGDIDNLPKVYDNIDFDEKHQTQTHNTMGIDYNGDGVDELAYFSLYTDKGEDNTFVSVTIYDREEKKDDSDVKYSWKKVGESEKKISKGNEFLDMMCQESKGYVAMAAGDYDHDGYEELACYFPCENKGYGEPFVGIIDINEENGTFDFEKDMKIIKLSEIRDQFSNLQSGKDSYESWHLPIVSLSTTSIRANEENVDTTKSYDDLVINVSVPRNYHDDNDNMNSCTAIYSYNKEKDTYECKFNEDTKFGTERMLSTNSVDADLNGDGYNELVVAGMRETGLSDSNNNSTGKIETGNNLVQLIYWNGSSYNFVWDTPKQVQASGQVQVDRHSQEPIAITAGRYNPNTINTMDYLCIQGVVLSCKDTKVYGVESVSANETDINKAVITTLPHHEKELFTDASFVTEYKLDFDGIANKNAFISTADSGFFNTKSQVQTIALLTGDESTMDDIIYYDIIFLTCDSDGNWHKRVYNDIIGYEDEDDHGTYMSINFLDCDKDQVYYKYTGKAVGYSSPTLYSIIQAPPYYKEANSASVSYTVTHGETSAVKGTWGIGANVGFNVPLVVQVSGIGKYVGSYTTSTNKSTSTTLKLRPDQDYAVCFVIPVIINKYKIFDPNANNGKGEWSDGAVKENLDPVLSALSLDEYNSFAAQLTDLEQRLAAPVIYKSNLPKSSAGDPHGYCHSLSELKEDMSIHKNDDDKILETDVLVNNDTNGKSNSISITNSTEWSHGFNLALNVVISGFGVSTGGVNFDGGASWVSSSSDGISFSITYDSLSETNKGKINNSTSDKYIDYLDTDGNPIQNDIHHYTYKDYIYNSSAVVYPSKGLPHYGDTKNGIYLCSYYTHNLVGTPAELPEYFGVQSVTQNADGTYNITLAWKTSVKNEKRTPDAYNIYVESLNSEDKDLSLVNTEGPIMRKEGSLIMTYEAKNLSNPDKNFSFYIASATTNDSNIITDVYESILMPAKTINVDKFLATDGLVITSQPKNAYIKNIGEDAEFRIEAEDTKKDALNISYQWETYNSKSGAWNPVTNNKSNDPKKYVFTARDNLIGTPIRCVITKTKSSSEHFTAISDIVTLFSKENHNHDYDEDGFCKICDGYEPAKYNTNIGAYEISNAGQLFWFAALVNGDHTLANFSFQDSGANAVLTKDIDLKSREWKPINSYSGKFDGKGYNISNLKITESGNNKGLFGSINGADISNFTLNGSISLNQNAKNIGGVVGESNGGKITNVSSYVTISNTGNSVLDHIGGVVGSINKVETVVEKCTFNGNIVINNTHDCIGGVVGYTDDGGKINNCANLGSVSATKAGAYVGGILGYKNRTAPSITNCYNYGTVSNNGNTDCCGAIIGWARKNENISNNYYLSTSTDKAFGSNSTSGLNATSKTKDEFASGEVTYLLNNNVTDGTQAWYQNIDNGKTPDLYPVLVGGTVYKGCCGTIYSNSNKSNHNFNENGFCTNCGKYEPANYNSKTGNYEISNAGQLFWFASLVNGDRTHADFSAQNSNANAVLAKDINLESREWKPINSYSGKFDGKGYKINNLKITESGSENGLFGSIDGADISNFTVSGSISPSKNTTSIGGIVGKSNGGKITNISSYVDISDKGYSNLTHVGGIVGCDNTQETVIKKCLFNGNITIDYSCSNIGGIIGYTNGGAIINNCANLGTVYSTETYNNTNIGGIVGCSYNKPTIKNSYNYGSVSNKGYLNANYLFCGAIIGLANETANLSNNYYLSTSCTNAFGKAGESEMYATAKTKDQFASGEVTYLLNNKVTDDTQVWYQNIDNGKTPDPYPVFVGGTVYSKGNDEYTNYDPDHKNDEFKKDENGSFIIEEYKDLVKLSELVRSDYKYYGSKNYILANNIVADTNSKWTQGIGSVSENKPFNGTFNGNGHYISGLNVDSPEYGGLFESIGDKGKVENLFLIDCDYITQSKVAGSIAAVNNGTIDHCLSGVNLTSGNVNIGNIHISPELNSLILGDLSGGVAGINNGTITGTRNAAIVMGTNCGGIAGENNGTIFGSANNGTIGKYKKEFADLAGGLAGTNNGIIKSSYNAEITDTTNKTYGSVAGVNNTSDVQNVHALCSNGINFIGKGVALDSTNVSYSDYHDMRGESFAKIMNSATDSESIVWVSNELLNKGYPTIQIVDFSTRTIDGGNGIILKGAAHDELNITYNKTDSDEFNQLKADNKGKVLGTYSVSLTDKNGNYVPAELWCKENFEMSVPVDRSNIQLASIGEDGSISYYKPVKIENGKATFNVPYPTSFAIVETSANSTNDTVTPSDSTPIKTGAVVCTALFAILVLSGAVFITVKRRNKFE